MWQARDGDSWADRLVLSRADFERGGARRWVTELHTFDPASGTAVCKVGEEQPADAGGAVRVEYTWREWDLANNREVRVLRVCGSPFEPLEGEGPGE